MLLAIDRPGLNGVQWANTAGYISEADTTGTLGAEFPSCTDYGREVRPVVDTAMYSGPGLSTPRIGTAWANSDVAAVCRINDSNGRRMILGIQRSGRNGVQWANTAGYLSDDALGTITDDVTQCGAS
jgi:hypothetical protein